MGRAQCWAPTPYQEPETKEDLGRELGSPTGGCEGEEGGGAFTTSPVLRAPGTGDPELGAPSPNFASPDGSPQAIFLGLDGFPKSRGFRL